MDIHNTPGNQNIRAQQRYREAMVEMVRRTRGKVQAAREQAANATAERTARQEIEVRPAPERRDRVEISRQQHERIQNARLDNAEADVRPTNGGEPKDRVEISRHLHARVQAYRLDNAGEDQNGKVERLRKAHNDGTLNTPERVERAAHNMLHAGGADAANPANPADPANGPDVPDMSGEG